MKEVVLIFKFLILTILLSIPRANAQPLPQNISTDTHLAQKIMGKVQISITGKSWSDSVTATIKISKNGAILYTSDLITFDTPDNFDKKNHTGCLDFEACQKKFFMELIDGVIINSRKNRYAQSATNYLTRQVVVGQLVSKGDSKTDEAELFINYLNTQDYNQFFIPAGPYRSQAILVYDNKLDRMIDIHAE